MARIAVLLICAAVLAGVFSPVLRAAGEEDPAALAAAVDASIAAIRKVTLSAEKAIVDARARYDELPDEAKALVKKLPDLEKAERTLQTLKDKAAAAEIKKLSDARKYEEAVALGEEYIAGRELSSVRGNVVKYILLSYARRGNAMIKAGLCEEAEAYLLACRDRYAEADTADLDRAIAALKKAVAEPESGAVLNTGAKGEYGAVTVRAGDAPAVIKLVSASDESRCLVFYVRAGETATAHIKDGVYHMRYATGGKWYGEREMFGSSTVCYAVDGPLQFSTDRVNNDVFSQRYEYTLHAAPEGASAAAPLAVEAF